MRLLFTLTLLLLTACGFHLRGAVVLPEYLAVMQVQDARPATQIAPDLRRALREQGVTVVDDPAQANVVLRLTSESFERRVQAVDASGRAREYGLYYRVAFSVLGPDGAAWLKDGSVAASRDLRFDETAVLGVGGEQGQLQTEMRGEAVRGILRQLAKVTPPADGGGR